MLGLTVWDLWFRVYGLGYKDCMLQFEALRHRSDGLLS